MKYKINSLQVINKAGDGYLSNIVVGEEVWVSGRISKAKSISPEWVSTERFKKLYKNKFYTVYLEGDRILQVPKDKYIAEWVPDSEVSNAKED